MLLIGPLCVSAVAQPPVGNGRPGRYAAAPPKAPASLPQHAVPFATRPTPLGLSTLPQAAGQYATPTSATIPPSGRPADTPAPADAQSAAPKGLRARFPKFFENVRSATTTPAQKLAKQAEAAQAVERTAAKPGQLVRAQQPVALPQGPVIVYMPAGWQPPQDITFAPRTMSPEVPEDFWPASTRNPLGEISGDGGLFRWPKFTRPNSPDELPVETPQRTRALLASSPEAAGDDSRTTATKRAWNALLGTTSGESARSANGQKRAKALFAGVASSTPRHRAPTPPARSTAAAPASRRQPAAQRPVTQRVAQPPARSVARTPRARAPAAAPAPQQSTSRLQSNVLADFHPSASETAGGQLKWRAKGAPRVSSPAADQSRNQVAAHVQPVDPMPTPAQPAPPGPPVIHSAVPQQPPAAPTSQAPAPVPVVRQKALIPRSVLTGKPATPGPTPAQPTTYPATQPTPAAGPTAATQQPTAYQATPGQAVATTPGSGKPLFPNMFAKDSPLTVSLTTKPRAATPAAPTPVQPVYVILSPEASSKMMESYYAPAEQEAESPERSHRKAKRKESPPRERPQARAPKTQSSERRPMRSREELARTARAQAAAARAQPRPEYVSPLEKPLRAISEMTKLPKFITGGSKARSAGPRSPRLRERYRATVARRADPRQKPQRTIRSDQLVEDELSELETDVAPDVAVDIPAKRREKADEQARDETESSEEDAPAAPAKTGGELTARQELDRLYQAATAGRAEEPRETAEAEADQPEEVAATEADDEQPAASANVPAVAIEQAAAPQTPEPPSTQIRKRDGTSVTVYHVGAAERTEKEEVVSPPVESRARGRRVVRQSERATPSQRRNPLR